MKKERITMGVWTIGIGNMTIRPQVDEKLIKEYIEFSNTCFPKEYGDEKFLNTWCFDENNKLFSMEGKFAEPSIWYQHIREKFFEPKGYKLEGKMIILGECDKGYDEACQISREKYYQWKERIQNYDLHNR